MKHFPSCTDQYPENPQDGDTTDIFLGNGVVIRSCNHCGAYLLLLVEVLLKTISLSGVKEIS